MCFSLYDYVIKIVNLILSDLVLVKEVENLCGNKIHVEIISLRNLLQFYWMTFINFLSDALMSSSNI